MSNINVVKLCFKHNKTEIKLFLLVKSLVINSSHDRGVDSFEERTFSATGFFFTLRKAAVGSKEDQSKKHGRFHFYKVILLKLQWTPLNGITLGPTKTDPINRMILLTESLFPMNKPVL